MAESLLALGWTAENVEAHVLSRYGYLSGPEAEQMVTWSGEALAAGELLENAPGGTLIDNSGAPCIPGLSGADWQIGYKFEWQNPDTGRTQAWYDNMSVPAGTSLQEIFDQADDLFADTVGEEYFGGNLGSLPDFSFAITSVICPA